MNKKHFKKFNLINKSSGQVSKILIIIAVVFFLVIAIVYAGVVVFSKKTKNSKSKESTTETTQPPKPVYETTVGNIRFVLQFSQSLGSILESKSSYEEDFKTTERFIKVVVGAQNKDKSNISLGSWDIGDIVDSEGRSFVSINDKLYNLLPKPDLCGTLLKPEFEPVPCVKYYEVSKASKGLKVMVKVTEGKKQQSLIDLKVQ
mgnify:CR=1 FL=1